MLWQVDIEDLTPRPNPGNDGRTYGSNAAASWGYQFRAGFLDGVQREVVTIYEIIKSPNGKAYVAVPDYQFRYGSVAAGSVLGACAGCDITNPIGVLLQLRLYILMTSCCLHDAQRARPQQPCLHS